MFRSRDGFTGQEMIRLRACRINGWSGQEMVRPRKGQDKRWADKRWSDQEIVRSEDDQVKR